MKKLKRRYKIILLLTLIVLLLPVGVSFGRFVTNSIFDYYLSLKHFYFTSNRLKRTNPLYRVNNWSGVDRVTVDFDLLSSINLIAKADYDIPYKISYTCDPKLNCDINKTQGVIYSSTNSDSISISAVPNTNLGTGDSVKIHVIATSSEPYIKDISADFEFVVGQSGLNYNIEDEVNKPYLNLNLSNAVSYYTVITAFGSHSVGDHISYIDYSKLSDADKSKCISQYVTISFDPHKFLIDSTDSTLNYSTITNTNIGGVDYVNRIVFPIDASSSKTIKFYKINVSEDNTYPNDSSTNSVISVSSRIPS